jgi:hypothetical protein
MRGLRRGSVAVEPGRLLAWLGLLGMAMGLAGCATSSAGEPTATRSYAAAAVRNAPDDPRQPFSLNYGLPPAARLSGPPTRMSSAEAEALIAHAIAEHEMRRP